MAKKKKVKSITPVKVEPIETQYYWCVNCGYHGDYGHMRKRNLKCEECGYNELTPFTKKEIKDINAGNMTLGIFGVINEKPPKSHAKYEKALKEAKVLIKEIKEEQSIADKIAAIRGIT